MIVLLKKEKKLHNPLQHSCIMICMFPFQFERKQFSLRPCFAKTINKAQGQTLKVIGLDLGQPIFAHGMLYVALSRTDFFISRTG